MYRRVLAATEENSKAKQSDLEKLELDIRKLEQELDQLNRSKVSLHRDVAAVQQQLKGKRGRGGGGRPPSAGVVVNGLLS